MHKQPVLVTGGAGYIGSHTCKALAQDGWLPVTYDNLSTGHDWAVNWGPLEVGDLRDTDKLTKVIQHYQPYAVLHFAAAIDVARSVSDPQWFYDNNVGGTESLLAAMSGRVTNMVFSSSCAVYGNPTVLPVVESCHVAPISPYGEHKAIVENMIAKQHQLAAVILRYFNAAGADLDGELGEAHEPETHLIPVLLTQGLLNKSPVTIYGDDYDTPDGTCVRDFIHVTDLARAHVLALKQLALTAGYTVYNLGSGQAYSVKQIIAAINAYTQQRLNYQIRPRRPGDPAVLLADPTRAIKKLNWQIAYSDINVIIKTAWQWLKNGH